MIKRFFIILICVSSPAFADVEVHGKIKCRETGDPVAYAHVMIGEGGVLTDSIGCFSMKNRSLSYPVTLNIRHIEYQPKSIIIRQPDSFIEIELEQQVLDGEEISIVAGQLFEIQSAVSARSISKKEIEALAPAGVSDVLDQEPGISIKSDYQSPIVLRGLSGLRLLILRNGNRRFGSYPAGFMSHTVNVYDLERIDVEKGPASVIYGAGAIAGIINLVDKSPFKQKGLNMRLTSGYASNNQEKSTILCGGWSNGLFAVKGAVRTRDANAYHFAGGREALNSDYADRDGFVSAGVQTEKYEMTLNLEMHRGGPWGKPVGFSGTNYLRVQTSDENSDHMNLSWIMHSGGWFESCFVSAYYADDSREQNQLYLNAADKSPSYREITHYSDGYYGLRVMPIFRLPGEVKLKTGAEAYHFNISSPMDITDYFEDYSFHNRVCRNARTNIAGVFCEMDAQATERLLFRSGLRYDMARVFEGDVFSLEADHEQESGAESWSGTFSANYRTSSWSRVKLNLARAFRMPTPQEMFSNQYTANGVLYGNPDLLPETSRNADMVFMINHPVFTIEASPFFWLLENMITKEVLMHMPGLNYEYANIGKARLWGGEISLSTRLGRMLPFSSDLNLKLAAAYTNGTDISEADSPTPLDYIPPFHLKAEAEYGVDWSKAVRFESMIWAGYYARQTRLPKSAYATPTYTLVSCMAGVRLRVLSGITSIRLVVNNLLDTPYYAFQSFVEGMGRDVRVVITVGSR